MNPGLRASPNTPNHSGQRSGRVDDTSDRLVVVPLATELPDSIFFPNGDPFAHVRSLRRMVNMKLDRSFGVAHAERQKQAETSTEVILLREGGLKTDL